MLQKGLITPEPETTEDEILDPDIGALLAQIMAANGQSMTMQVADVPSTAANIVSTESNPEECASTATDLEHENNTPSMYSISDEFEDTGADNVEMFSITMDDTDEDDDLCLDLPDTPTVEIPLSEAEALVATDLDITSSDYDSAHIITVETESQDIQTISAQDTESDVVDGIHPELINTFVDGEKIAARVSTDFNAAFTSDDENLNSLTAQFEQMNLSRAVEQSSEDVLQETKQEPSEAVDVDEIIAQVNHDIHTNKLESEDDTLLNLTEQFERMHLSEPIEVAEKPHYTAIQNEVVNVDAIMAQVASDLNTHVSEDDNLTSLASQFERIKSEYPVKTQKTHQTFGISEAEIHRSELRAKAAETTAEHLKAIEHESIQEPLTADDTFKATNEEAVDVIAADTSEVVDSTPTEDSDNQIHMESAPPVSVKEEPLVPAPQPRKVDGELQHNTPTEEPSIPERRRDTPAPTRRGFLTNATMFSTQGQQSPVVRNQPTAVPAVTTSEQTVPEREKPKEIHTATPRTRTVPAMSATKGDIDLKLVTEDGVLKDVFKLLSKYVAEHVTEINTLKEQLHANRNTGASSNAQPDYELLTQLALMEEENNNLKIANTTLTKKSLSLEQETVRLRKKYEDMLQEMVELQSDNTRLERELRKH